MSASQTSITATAPAPKAQAEYLSVLMAIPLPILVLGPDEIPVFANLAAEVFFSRSLSQLEKITANQLFPRHSPILQLIAQVRKTRAGVSEYGVDLTTPNKQSGLIDIQVMPMHDQPGHLLILLQQRNIAERMDRQMSTKGAARSVSAMAAMLAHEVKNPLSGIRGAAQLLEQGASSEDQVFTRLICEETDRICGIMDRMDVFSDEIRLKTGPVNIHEILDHVVLLAETGFGNGIIFTRNYDPSLPLIEGNRDQLIQLFLNLIKNAAEAAPVDGGEITIGSAFRPGVRLRVAGSRKSPVLPLEISVSDNGPGVPEDILPHLFDPFVTSKQGGTGLGLALVSKITADHGGSVEYLRDVYQSRFRVLLPIPTQAPGEIN